MSAFQLEQFDAKQLQAHLPDFVTLLQETINGGASLGFLPPLSADEADKYWQKVEGELAKTNVLLFCVLDKGTVVATVQLQPSVRAN